MFLYIKQRNPNKLHRDTIKRIPQFIVEIICMQWCGIKEYKNKLKQKKNRLNRTACHRRLFQLIGNYRSNNNLITLERISINLISSNLLFNN